MVLITRDFTCKKEQQPLSPLLSAGSSQLREKMRLRVPALLRPQVPWGQQIPAQTRTRFNCQKTGSVGLSTAEGQPPVYPAGGLSIPLAARVSKPCFKKWQEQGLVWCCLFAAYIVRLPCFSSKFFCITYLTSYHWTRIKRFRVFKCETAYYKIRKRSISKVSRLQKQLREYAKSSLWKGCPSES